MTRKRVIADALDQWACGGMQVSDAIAFAVDQGIILGLEMAGRIIRRRPGPVYDEYNEDEYWGHKQHARACRDAARKRKEKMR